MQAIPAELGRPDAVAMDAGYFGPATIQAFEAMGIDPHIAVGRGSHQGDISPTIVTMITTNCSSPPVVDDTLW